jgi:hypothetical protein
MPLRWTCTGCYRPQLYGAPHFAGEPPVPLCGLRYFGCDGRPLQPRPQRRRQAKEARSLFCVAPTGLISWEAANPRAHALGYSCVTPFGGCGPSTIVRRPSSVVHRPSSVVRRPSSIVHRPSSVVHRLSSIVYRLSSIAPRTPYSLSPYTVLVRLNPARLMAMIGTQSDAGAAPAWKGFRGLAGRGWPWHKCSRSRSYLRAYTRGGSEMDSKLIVAVPVFLLGLTGIALAHSSHATAPQSNFTSLSRPAEQFWCDWGGGLMRFVGHRAVSILNPRREVAECARPGLI